MLSKGPISRIDPILPMEHTTVTEADALRKQLAQIAEANRDDLVNCYIRCLRETLFTNRSDLRPGQLKEIASNEVDALLTFLVDPRFSVIEHGMQLRKQGLSDQTLLGLGKAVRQSFFGFLEPALLVSAIEILDSFQNALIEGFIKEHEKIILYEQEQIRSAFEIAISRYTIEIKEVQSLAQKATEANEFKTHFIARISHELRTPLGALLGMSEMLQENVYGPLTPAQQDIVQRIIANTHLLEQVFTELLDQSRIEAGQLHLKMGEFSPKILAHTVHSNNLSLAIKKGLSMHIDIDPNLPDMLIGDKARIEQILSNLVVNAIKYTRTGEIMIRVRLEGAKQWLMQVQDTGIGISEEDQEYIFEPFRQVDETVGRKFGGVGLGLSIVKQLVKAMDGTVGVDSRLGQGSTFTVILPLHKFRRLEDRHAA
jgi:signal transduction histidine kinase